MTAAAGETVAVVVIGRNEGERLARCLAAVNAMDYPADRLEKIYVDSESTDGSGERAAGAGFRVRRYRAEFRTAAGARDLGWRAARSRFIFFLDGDCAVEPDFLRQAVSCALNVGATAVSGRIREIESDRCARRRTLALHWEVNRKARVGESFYGGGCSLVDRSALQEIDGFNVELAATENNDLGRRLGERGRKVWFLDRPMVLHDSGATKWREIFRRCVRNGYWFERYCRLPATDTIASGPPDVRKNALRKAAPSLAVLAVGAGLAGPGGVLAGAAVAAGAALWRRTAKVRCIKGGGWSTVRDGALLGLYDFSVWCGQARALAEFCTRRPGAFRTGPDWRSE